MCAMAVGLGIGAGCGPNPGLVEGIVIDEMGDPVDGVWLRVDDSLITKTSDGGRFSFSSVPASYSVTAGVVLRGNGTVVVFSDLTTRRPVLHVVDRFRSHPSVEYSGRLDGVSDYITGCAFTNEYSGPRTVVPGQFVISGSHTGPAVPTTRLVVFPYPLSETSALIADRQVANVGEHVDVGTLVPTATPTATVSWHAIGIDLREANLVASDGNRCRLGAVVGVEHVVVPVLPGATLQLKFADGFTSTTLTRPIQSADLGEIMLPQRTQLSSPSVGTYASQSVGFSLATRIEWQGLGGASEVNLMCPNYSGTIYLTGSSVYFPSEALHRLVGIVPPSGACTLSVTTSWASDSDRSWTREGPWEDPGASSTAGGYVTVN